MKSERLIALILVLAMALSFVSCGEIKYVTIDGSDQQTDSEENPSDNQKPVEDEKQPDDQEKDPETNDSGNIENQPSDGHKTIYIYSAANVFHRAQNFFTLDHFCSSKPILYKCCSTF